MRNTIECALKEPYPPVKPPRRNLRYADLITSAFGGQNSEMTAITLYLYQHFICMDERISGALECVARVEMRHLDMLGKLIDGYGGQPRFGARSGRGIRYWTGQYLNYETDPRVFLKKNILAEEDAIEDYYRLIKLIEDNDTTAVLKRIILDEEHHIKVFSELLRGLS